MAHILYYITGHGYGHAVRASVICNRLDRSHHLTMCTSIPRRFFDEELTRPFTYRATAFDCGCLQSNAVTVDIDATVDAYKLIADSNAMLLHHEVAWCKEQQVSIIIADITSFAFEVANAAGLPSVAITNFTWYDIYEPYLLKRPDFAPYLNTIRTQYGYADVLLALSPAMPMAYFKKRREMPLLGRIGTTRRRAIAERYAIDPHKKLALIYLGDFGMSRINWQALASLTGWHFAGLYAFDDAPDNYTVIDKKEFRYQDIIASVDCMVTKLGYGSVAECFLHGVPVLFTPRNDFAEHPYLLQAVTQWGHGYSLPATAFEHLQWGPALNSISLNSKPLPQHSNSTDLCLAEIEMLLIR